MRINRTEHSWDAMYEEALNQLPFLKGHVMRWYPVGESEITIEDDSGEAYIYNDAFHMFRLMREGAVSETVLSEEEWMREFARNLRAKMYDRCVNQHRLSKLIGISDRTLSLYLTCKSVPSSYTLYCICHELGCSPSELFPY